jgi:hypothetical protein
MDLQELATCACREPDAIAPTIAKAALALITGAPPETTAAASLTQIVGYALVPVTLTDAEVGAMLLKVKKNGGCSQTALAADCLLQEGMQRKEELKKAMAIALCEETTSLDGIFFHPVFGIEAVLGSRVNDGDHEVHVKWANTGEENTWELRSDLVLFSEELPALLPRQRKKLAVPAVQGQCPWSGWAKARAHGDTWIRDELQPQQPQRDTVYELVSMTPATMLPALAASIDGFLVRLYLTRSPSEPLGLHIESNGEPATFQIANVAPSSSAQAAGAREGDILVSLGDNLAKNILVGAHKPFYAISTPSHKNAVCNSRTSAASSKSLRRCPLVLTSSSCGHSNRSRFRLRSGHDFASFSKGTEFSTERL